MIKSIRHIVETFERLPYGRYKPFSNYVSDKVRSDIEYSVLKLNLKGIEILEKYITEEIGKLELKRLGNPYMFICHGALPEPLRKDNGVTKKIIINGYYLDSEKLVFRCTGYHSSNLQPYILFSSDTGESKNIPKNIIYKNIREVEVFGNVLEIEK